jgi:mono/diheme cytochrome c family protein
MERDTLQVRSGHTPRFSCYPRILNILAALLISATFATPVFPQYLPEASHVKTNFAAGEQIYKSACAACHGPDGRGTSETIRGFQAPDTFPDFTRCDQTTAEANLAWKAVIVQGGPTRGFSQIMPSFSEALTSQQMDDVIAYMRKFCTNSTWPAGELNLPRAFGTEKAYPEDEEVMTTALNAQGAPGLEMHVIHEQRFGVKNQIEVDVPILAQDLNHTWYGGIGDAVFGVKRVMFSSLRTGSILALQGEIAVPSGNRSRGFGSGTTTFGMFASAGQLFHDNSFIQFQGGADLPVHTDIAPQSVYWNTALGHTFVANHGLGRMWSPMIEFLATRDLVTSAKTDWDVLPEMQVTISRRQHVRFDLGYRAPVSNTQGRQGQLMFYMLWDWADGKLTEGW